MIPYNRPRRSQGRLTRRTLLKTIAVAGLATSVSWLAACGGEGGAKATGSVIEMTDQSQLVPMTHTIKVGETVTWRNKGTLVHNVTTDPKRVQNAANVKLPEGVAPFDSGTIASGGSWSRRFDVPGEYRYCCVPHEFVGMVGTLLVEA